MILNNSAVSFGLNLALPQPIPLILRTSRPISGIELKTPVVGGLFHVPGLPAFNLPNCLISTCCHHLAVHEARSASLVFRLISVLLHLRFGPRLSERCLVLLYLAIRYLLERSEILNSMFEARLVELVAGSEPGLPSLG